VANSCQPEIEAIAITLTTTTATNIIIINFLILYRAWLALSA